MHGLSELHDYAWVTGCLRKAKHDFGMRSLNLCCMGCFEVARFRSMQTVSAKFGREETNFQVSRFPGECTHDVMGLDACCRLSLVNALGLANAP